MDANQVLWIGQILLALAFLAAGSMHVFGFERASTAQGMAWLAAVGRDRMRIIGTLEILGGIGLLLPAATGVLPWLTPVAATCLAVLMVLAIVLHARRPGEGPNIALNVVLGRDRRIDRLRPVRRRPVLKLGDRLRLKAHPEDRLRASS